MLLQILTLLGSLALVVFGMDFLTSGIQRYFGERLRRFENWMKSGAPFKQILSGAGISALLQSSSATTLIVISLVSAASLTLVQGICVLMGANIGTTITAWLIAFLGFATDLKAYAFIVVGVGFLMTMLKKTCIKNLGQAVLGLALVLVGLIFMKNSVPSTDTVPATATALLSMTSHGFWSVLAFMFAGMVIAFLLQSSSAAVIFTMVLVSLGWISFPIGAAMVVGSNIGTTVSPNFIARSGGVPARRTALAHTVFNVAGAVFVLALWGPFTRLCLTLASPAAPAFSGALGIACAHTLFNVLATCILVWFRKPMARMLTCAVADPEPQEGDFNLKFIGSGRIVGTPSISIEQAYKECVNDACTARDGFRHVRLALNEKDPDIFEAHRAKLVKCEEVTDRFEAEVAAFLNRVSACSPSEGEAGEIKVLYRIIGEIESLGDSCENISRLLVRLRVRNLEFDGEMSAKLNLLLDKVDDAFDVMVNNLKLASEGSLSDISNAYAAEDAINATRNSLRDEGILTIGKGDGHFLTVNYYLDMLAELEAMGDFMINVSQSLFHVFDK